MDESVLADMFAALHFAADKHRDQRRKDVGGAPYINHPIEVAELLIRVGGITDRVTLIGALLHDTIEDTETTSDELSNCFGPDVRDLVLEVTDDKHLPKSMRKQLQVDHAPHLSSAAKHVKLADKIANVISVTENPPADWPLQRRLEYLDWTERVVAGLRGCNPALEELYDKSLCHGRAILGADGP